MVTTTMMIRLGMTYSNWMINVSMTNQKLRERGSTFFRKFSASHRTKPQSWLKHRINFESGRNHGRDRMRSQGSRETADGVEWKPSQRSRSSRKRP